MNRSPASRPALVCLAAASLSACALFPHHRQSARIEPVHINTATPDVLADAGLYQDAVKAVGQRDYARALDLLQAARARRPDDARVWNAFGVVYDKLGRFDLSPRYYAKAEALDPGSAIVATNRAYSALMQGKGAPPVTALARAAPVPRRPTAAFAQAAAPAFPPRAPVALALTQSALMIAGTARAAADDFAVATAGGDFDGGKISKR
jgi:Flp pilus assembly protein TadD